MTVARAWRWVVIGIFSLVTLYIPLAVIISVARDLYGKPPGETNSAGESTRDWCRNHLAGLLQELEHEITFELDHPSREGDPMGRFAAWEPRWTKQLEQVNERCENEPAMQQMSGTLESIHATYKDSLTAIATTRGGPSRSLEAALQKFK